MGGCHGMTATIQLNCWDNTVIAETHESLTLTKIRNLISFPKIFFSGCLQEGSRSSGSRSVCQFLQWRSTDIYGVPQVLSQSGHGHPRTLWTVRNQWPPDHELH